VNRRDFLRLVAAALAAAPAIPLARAEDEKPADPVLAALEKLEPILEAKDRGLHWIEGGLDPLRDGLAAVRAGKVKALDAAVARARVAAAQVVLVGDLHHLDPCRVAFARAVETLSDPEALRAGRVAMAFEAVPAVWEERLADAREEGADLPGFLEACWPWPVKEYAALLRREKLAAVPALAAGGQPGPVPAAGTEDAERRPVWGAVTDVMDWKYGTSFYGRNQWAVHRVTQWLKPGRRAFVLYGAAHHLERGQEAANLKQALEKAGCTVVVLFPLLPEWEIALRRRDGAKASGRWYEVLPGVFRAPLVTDDEIGKLRVPDVQPEIRLAPLPEPASKPQPDDG